MPHQIAVRSGLVRRRSSNAYEHQQSLTDRERQPLRGALDPRVALLADREGGTVAAARKELRRHRRALLPFKSTIYTAFDCAP
jgi:hypothetical protein